MRSVADRQSAALVAAHVASASLMAVTRGGRTIAKCETDPSDSVQSQLEF
jgi:hypothetical protein